MYGADERDKQHHEDSTRHFLKLGHSAKQLTRNTREKKKKPARLRET